MQENVMGKIKVALVIKNKLEGVVLKWLVFFEKSLNETANLDQKTCKKKTVRGKLGKDSIKSS